MNLILGESLLAIKLYLIMTSTLTLSEEKKCHRKDRKTWSSSLGLLLLLQPRATTIVTRSHWDPEIPTCRENTRVCVSPVQKN